MPISTTSAATTRTTGTSNFPNAQFYITQADFDFWTDESKPKEMKTFIDTARKNLLPNKDRLHFIKDGSEVLPGVHAILAPGHTVGTRSS